MVRWIKDTWAKAQWSEGVYQTHMVLISADTDSQPDYLATIRRKDGQPLREDDVRQAMADIKRKYGFELRNSDPIDWEV